MTSDEVMPKCSQRADFADVLLHRGGEGDDVVLRGLFDFFDACDVEAAPVANVVRGGGRHDAGPRHRFGGGDFDLQPGFVSMLVAPDATHVRMGVAGDHR